MNRTEDGGIAIRRTFTRACLLSLLGLAVALAAASLAQASHPFVNHYWVATTGSDSDPGTKTLPWRTIQHAVNTLAPGDDVTVMNGTYNEQVICYGNNGTDDGGDGPGHAVALYAENLYGAIINSTADGVLKIDCDYLHVQGFKITGSTHTSGANVWVASQISPARSSTHNVLTRNWVTGGSCQGIYLAGTGTESTSTADNLVTRNKVNGNGDTTCLPRAHGIYVEGFRNEVSNNLVYDHPWGSGIHNYDDATDTKILFNTSAFNGGDFAGDCNCGSGIVVDGSTDDPNTGAIVVGNIVYDNDQDGLNFGNGGSVEDCYYISNNLAYLNLRNWDNSFPMDCFSEANQFVGNPVFVNAGSRDFHLQSTSYARDRGGTQYVPEVDFDGRTRPYGDSIAHIGAFEYAG